MKSLVRLLVGLAALAVAPGSVAADPKAVVELFTSQGCSSCKGADLYFAELAGRSDVIAYSLHVDYWDYLGWRDTFGMAENTARQREYSHVRGSGRIYTPQIVLNGTTDFIGSHREAVDAAIARSALPLQVSMRRKKGALRIEVGARPLPGRHPTTIRLILFTSKATLKIPRGENAGATIAYHNIVRAIRPVGMWDGGAVTITLPEAELLGDGVDGSAVIVQEDLPNGPGAILGAAQLRDLR